MKRVIYITIGLNLVWVGKTFADDSLTGLHLGFGLNVVADEYKSDVDILGVCRYMENIDKQTWEFTGPKYTPKNADTSGEYIDNGLTENNGYSVQYTKNDNVHKITINDPDTDSIANKTNYVYDDRILPNVWRLEQGTRNELIPPGKISIDIQNNKVMLSEVPVHAKKGRLTDRLVKAVTSATNDITTIGSLYNKLYDDVSDFNFSGENKIRYPNLKSAIVKHYDPLRPEYVYMNSSRNISRKSIKCGGELKIAYYHSFTNNLSFGVDISGNVTSNTKKSSIISKLHGSIINGQAGLPLEEYIISHKNTPNKKVKYANNIMQGIDGAFSGDNPQNDNAIEFFFWDMENGLTIIPERTYTIEQEMEGGTKANTSNFITSNPDYTVLDAQPSDPSQYLQISNEKGGDVSFEKNKFNSRAAVVLGAQYKGWFAGVRGGISYNQGKLHVKDSTGTSSEEVSFASPFVGVHLMKSVNMKGLENGHIYVTADVNVQNKQNLKMKGIKNFRQNSVNVSLGMTWQIN